MAFDVGSIEATLTLDRKPFTSELELAKQAARGFAGSTYSANVGLDIADMMDDIAAAKRALASISDEEVKIRGDASDLNRAVASSKNQMSSLSREAATIPIKADDSDWTGAYARTRTGAGEINRLSATASIKGNEKDFERKKDLSLAWVALLKAQEAEIQIRGDNSNLVGSVNNSRVLARAVNMLKPQVVIAGINDPLGSAVKQSKGMIQSLVRTPSTVKFRVDNGDSVRQASILGEAIRKTGNSAVTLNTTLTGKDGSIARKVIALGGGMADAAGKAAAMALQLGQFATQAAAAGSAAGGMGGKMGGLITQMGMSAAGAGAAALAFGVLAAAIMPIMAILATGVATLAAVAAGLGLVGAAGAMLAKDFGTVSAANNRVEDAQYALNQAMKAGEGGAKKLAEEEKKLAGLEKSQTAAKDRLSKAWDTLNAARDPKNVQGTIAAEKAIDTAQRNQDAATSRLDDAWKKLNAARSSKDTAKIKAAEQELAAAQRAEEATTKKLDTAFGMLDKTRSPSNAKAVAKAEKEVEAAQKAVDKTTSSVEAAQKKLNAARESGSGMRILEAERELGKAQNAQAVALKKASGGSKEYAAGLDRLHKEASLLGPAFRKAFTPAAAKIAQITADVMVAARQAMPLLGRTSKAATDQMKEGFDKGHQSSTRLRDVLNPLPGIMGDLGGLTKNLQSAWTSFMDVALPYVKDFTQWAENASRRLAEWMDSEDGRKKIAEFLDMAAPVAQKLGEFFKTVGTRLFELAKEHGPLVLEFLDLMVGSVDLVTGALEAALDIAKSLLDIWKSVNEFSEKNQKGKKGTAVDHGQTMSPTYARGGDHMAYSVGGDHGQASLYTAARGLSELGAHFVNGPTYGAEGNNLALYGEQLSPGNREYAFPMEPGVTRFITEEPGYDGDSYGLWRDLGRRKGYFTNNTGPTPKAPSVSAGASGSQRAGSPMATLERKIDRQTAALVGAAERQVEATQGVGPAVRDGVNHNNQFSSQGRTAVTMGLSRQAIKRIFEGTLR